MQTMRANIIAALLVSSIATPSAAFVQRPIGRISRASVRAYNLKDSSSESVGSFDPLHVSDGSMQNDLTIGGENKNGARLAKVSATVLAALSAMPAVSHADSPDWGIFEGKTGSLLHPAMMASLFLFSVNTALKGFDWRKQRTMGDQISALKKQMPKLPEGAKTLAQAIEMGKEAGENVSVYQGALSTESEIASLTAERKELSSQNNRDKHYNQGAILAALGTAFAIEGPLNTYARAGKLFPGPHLYAGAGLVVCWAMAGACVPFMQKGNDTARTVHIGANVLGMGLFAWQIQSGIPILLKVWEKTHWP